MSNQIPRILQSKQPEESEQKPSASPDSQGVPGARREEKGENSHEGTREYGKRTADYLKKADVDADAQAAKPQSDPDARTMQRAEDEARSHAKGEH